MPNLGYEYEKFIDISSSGEISDASSLIGVMDLEVLNVVLLESIHSLANIIVIGDSFKYKRFRRKWS